MARFRAFDSDSSSSEDEQPENKSVENIQDEEQESEPEEESEDGGGEEFESEESDSDDSAMLEDELLEGGRQTLRPRKALFQDENGDFQVTRDDDEDIEDDSRSGSSRMSPSGDHQLAGPSQNIIPWARHIGVDAQKMHVMQTSLFRMPEEAAALKALNNQPPTRPKAVAALIAPSMNRKHSRDSDDGGRPESRERASFAHDIHGSGPRPSRKYARVEVESSIMDDKERAYVDAGLAFGRSFRVGWGPGGMLAHGGVICAPYAPSTNASNSSVVHITPTPFPSIPESEDSPASISQKLLQHHLTQTPITKSDTDVPVASPASSTSPLDFASFASLFPTTQTSGPASLFRLGSALFDPIDLRFGPKGVPPEVKDRVTLLRRRHALSQWLEHVVKSAVEGDIRVKATGPMPGNYTEVDTVFTALTGHQVEQACSIAMDAKYFKLATLISQAGGDATFKADIRAQLDIWKEEKLAPSVGGGGLGAGPNGLISRGVWKVYRLLSGPDDLSSEDSTAKWVEEVCAGLDWRRVFGLCLWYGMGVDAAVADVVHLYETLTGRYSPAMVARPIPLWQVESNRARPAAQGALTSIVRGTTSGSIARLPGPLPPQQHEDPHYSLIRLHANPELTLSQVLEPQSFGPDQRHGGVGMCWHLYIILSRVMKLRDFGDRAPAAVSAPRNRTNGVNGRQVSHDNSDSEQEEGASLADGHSHTANLLTSAYAFELEGWGMIQEAAFVLLHLEDAEGRRKAIKDLLARSAPKIDEWETRGLVGSLKIPFTWVHEAKAIHALNEGNVYEAYELYLSAQLWNAAHDLAVLELAPDAILRRDVELLQELFEPFDLEGRRDKIEGWYVRGKIFVDYAHILIRLPQLQDKLLTERESNVVVDPPPGETSTVEEIDELTRKIPKLVALLPDVLHRSRTMDDRHVAAIEEMTQSLLSVTEKVKPTMLLKQPLLSFMDPSTKLALIRGKSYARFLQKVSA